MVVVCFILISTKPAREHSVYDSLIKMPEIDRVQPLFGEWDLFVEVKLPDLNAVNPFVGKIKKDSDIVDTKVLTGMKF